MAINPHTRGDFAPPSFIHAYASDLIAGAVLALFFASLIVGMAVLSS
jgi:hypothetical protein